MSFFASALVMGFLSGGHCLGMCGPLVLALPVSEDRVWISVFYRVIYNFGRVFTYTILGGIAGAVAALFSLQVLQARVAQIAGALLILLALLQLLPHIHLGFLSRAHAFIARTIAPLLRNAGRGRFFLLGMLNGILPCGMVAAALLVSIAAETWLSGIAYMAVFGAGTFPLMLLASVFGIYLSGRMRQVVSWAGPLYAIALGILLLLRPALIAPHCAR
ncbi:MAG TPA: sulfite exporter TauE/SafE family protein [Turneriella sp.]|nr:sulfite exporter TauE/SafE family protein [Turneriella sp.]HNL10433.1 sulfite exporter TauE/SafE family protein [Turneriella sp.]HNN00007.1 sulfite exporter TauE/SafE family protein [Turneriella sp.]